MGLSKAQKALLAWSIIFIAAAEAARALHVEGRAATLLGLAEVVLAVITGIAFGVAQTSKGEQP